MPGDGLPPARVERYFLPRLFGEIGTALMLDDVLREARDWQPDLLVFDPLLYAGPLVAAIEAIPPVLHAVGPLTDPAVVDLVADAVSPIWREFRREAPRDAGLFSCAVVSICPPSLDPASAGLPNAHRLRPTALPRTSDRAAARRSCGSGRSSAAAELEVSAIVTVGRDNDPSVLGDVPANVLVAQFIPQADLLPHCAAVIHHAGAGTAFGVVAHALPSVALPQSADNFVIADRLAAAHAARVLMPEQVTVISLRDAVRDVMADLSYQQGAGRLAHEIAGMAAPEEVAQTLRAM